LRRDADNEDMNREGAETQLRLLAEVRARLPLSWDGNP
jgi:hypothetical protein